MVKIYGSKKLTPMSSSDAQTNSIFIDSDDDQLKFKDSSSNISYLSKSFSHAKLFSLFGLNKIREAFDRSVSSSPLDDYFVEAYVDENGRNNSFTYDSAPIALHINNSYYKIGMVPTNRYDDDSRNNGTVDTSKWTITSSGTYNITDKKIYMYAHDNDTGEQSVTLESNDTTLDTSKEYLIGGKAQLYDTDGGGWSNGNSTVTIYFGGVSVFSRSHTSSGNYNQTWDFLIHIRYNGGWEYKDVINGSSYSSFSPSDAKFKYYTHARQDNSDSTNRAYLWVNFEGNGTTGSVDLEHTIPSGTFNSDVSSSICKTLIKDTESGASFQYKVSNASENSGWINDGELGTFTAFTSEPTTLTVKLTPKSSSPTIGYPSIRGVFLVCE